MARIAVQESSLPVWQDRNGPTSYRVAGDIWDWLDPATHARRSRSVAMLHSRWRDAERKWEMEVGRTKDEYSRLAQQAAEVEAVWATAGDEVHDDDGRAAAEELQRAIELSLQVDPDLQLAIQLSLEYASSSDDASCYDHESSG